VGFFPLFPGVCFLAGVICNFGLFDLVKRNLLPFLIGLVVTTVVAIFLIKNKMKFKSQGDYLGFSFVIS